jgi:predicted nucleotidyltransferase
MAKIIDGHTIALSALVGSHNYNLNTESSDVDYKFFVFPTFDDLYTRTMYHKSIVTDEADYDIHDIRELPELLWKSHINYLEILYSIDLSGNDELIKYIYAHRDEIAGCNPTQIYKACLYTAKNKQKLMLSDSYTRHDSIAKYGYSVKSAYHALLYLWFIERYAKDWNYGSSLQFDGKQREILMEIKRGKYTKNMVDELIEKAEDKAVALQEVYLSRKCDKTSCIAFDFKLQKILKDYLSDKVEDSNETSRC